MNKMKILYSAAAFFLVTSLSAIPTRSPDGSISCNSGGCTYVGVQSDGTIIVCDSDGCIHFTSAQYGGPI